MFIYDPQSHWYVSGPVVSSLDVATSILCCCSYEKSGVYEEIDCTYCCYKLSTGKYSTNLLSVVSREFYSFQNLSI